ncbi:hypothetical protein OV208_25485 [Corallococcus sp. bb12-1]|uniref:hypothetical protein n=1 Tax=Corallococcus sp. bb12-1 TaxID=2996784 RepID=UPI0022711EA4|nr:hypothetical protein [Corallococcus sp. bb12-1]MCY1044695.1 hypothetical protein [Corallococcus sp. bb12-1]
MNWRTITLHGGASISRIANTYEVQDRRIPGTKYKVKVLERGLGDFLAMPNVCVKNNAGEPDWIAGLGRTEFEALQDIIDRMNESLISAERLTPEDFEWSDPHDF